MNPSLVMINMTRGCGKEINGSWTGTLLVPHWAAARSSLSQICSQLHVAHFPGYYTSSNCSARIEIWTWYPAFSHEHTMAIKREDACEPWATGEKHHHHHALRHHSSLHGQIRPLGMSNLSKWIECRIHKRFPRYRWQVWSLEIHQEPISTWSSWWNSRRVSWS